MANESKVEPLQITPIEPSRLSLICTSDRATSESHEEKLICDKAAEDQSSMLTRGFENKQILKVRRKKVQTMEKEHQPSNLETDQVALEDMDMEKYQVLKKVKSEASLSTTETKKPNYIILPDGKIRQKWDLMMLLVLLYTSIVVPFRVCFEVNSEGVSFYFEWIIDIIFCFDIVLNFLTAYEVGSKTITDPKYIARNYLKSWFIFDAVASIPFNLIDHGNDSMLLHTAKLARLPRLLRIFKLLRLLKLLRMFKLQHYVRRLETTYDIHSGLSRLINIMLLVFLVAHIIGSIWHYIPVLEADQEVVITSVGITGVNIDSWISIRGLNNSTTAKRYVSSAYWTFTTMTTVGYGDIHGETIGEMVFCMIVQMTGVLWYAFLISSMTAIINTFDKYNQIIREKQDKLSTFCRITNIPTSLRKRLRTYLEYHFHDNIQTQTSVAGEVLAIMSPELRLEVTIFVHRQLIAQIPFFIGRKLNFVGAMVTMFSPVFCHSHDYVYHEGTAAQNIYFLVSGKAVILKGKQMKELLEKGQYTGEIGCVLAEVYWESCKALMLSEMQALSRKNLLDLMVQFPDFASEIEQLALKRLNLYINSRYTINNDQVSDVMAELENLDLNRRRSSTFERGTSKLAVNSTAVPTINRPRQSISIDGALEKRLVDLEESMSIKLLQMQERMNDKIEKMMTEITKLLTDASSNVSTKPAARTSTSSSTIPRRRNSVFESFAKPSTSSTIADTVADGFAETNTQTDAVK